MIEMLGVLAIIAVLSVGGIAGYSKAMRMYKMYKTVDIFNNIFNQIISLEHKNLGKEYLDYEQLIAIDVIPKSQLLPLGGWFYTTLTPANPIEINFEIYLTTEKDCIDFLSYHWESHIPNEWAICSSIDDNIEGDYYTIGLLGKGKKLNMEKIKEACSMCKNGECELYFEINELSNCK